MFALLQCLPGVETRCRLIIASISVQIPILMSGAVARRCPLHHPLNPLDLVVHHLELVVIFLVLPLPGRAARAAILGQLSAPH